MEVQAVPAAAAALGDIWVPADMAEVIIGPDQGHVLRQLQPPVVQRQHFFVGNEGLERLLSLFLPKDILQYLPLIPNDLT
ncbi:hypothetical protein D3C71_2146660 [compost metagenome]